MPTGDAVFLELYEAHAARLHTYCLSITQAPDDAADALQDTFTAVLARLEADETPIEHPKAYLYASARHACLRRVHERGRVEVVSEVPEAEPQPGVADGEREVLTDELRADVRAANVRLPERQREILFLREVEELSYAEIGDVMELTPNGAAQLAWRARAGLRHTLRAGALFAITPAGPDCERALTLVELREDTGIGPEESAWLDAHLDECERCRASRGAMLEVGSTYRAAIPIAALPFGAEDALAHARGVIDGAAGAAGAGAGVGSGVGASTAASSFVHGHRALIATTAAVAVTIATWMLAGSLGTPSIPPPVDVASASPPAPERVFAAEDEDSADDRDRESRSDRDDGDDDGSGGGDDDGDPDGDGGDDGDAPVHDPEPITGLTPDAVDAPGPGVQPVQPADPVAQSAPSRNPPPAAPPAGTAPTATPVVLSSGPQPPSATPASPPTDPDDPPPDDGEPGPPGEEPVEPAACDPKDDANDSSGPGSACDPRQCEPDEDENRGPDDDEPPAWCERLAEEQDERVLVLEVAPPR